MNENKERVLFSIVFFMTIIIIHGFAYGEDSKFALKEITPPHLNFYPHRILIYEHYAIVAGWSTGVHFFDLTDPARPRWVNKIDVNGEAIDIKVWNNLLFVADKGFSIIDIKSVDDAYLVKSIKSRFDAKKLEVDGNCVFLLTDVGILIYDIKNLSDIGLIKYLDYST